MMIMGLALTGEDMARIAAAVTTLSISMMNEATSIDDLREAAELAKLGNKLAKAMAEMKNVSDKNEHGDTCES